MPHPDRICVGAIAGSFGVQGEVRLKSFCSDPEAIADYGPLYSEDGTKSFKVKLTRPVAGGLGARISGVDTKEQADALKGVSLYVDRAKLPSLPDDEFYHADLIGLEARDADDAVIGRVKSVQNFGASDMLEIAPVSGGQTWYLPFTREAAPDLRISEGWLRVVRPTEVDERDEA